MDIAGTQRHGLGRAVDVIGVGMSPLGIVGETPGFEHVTSRELWAYAADEAMKDAGIMPKDVEALFLGNMVGEMAEGQYHMAYVMEQWTGLSLGGETWKPAVRIEGACASSSHALRQAVFAVASGAYDIVIAGGVEVNNAKTTWDDPGAPRKMTNQERVEAIYGHYDQAWELPQMAMLDHTLSQWLIAYAKRYGLSRETLEEVLNKRLISNYHNGVLNPRAFWKTSLEDAAQKAGYDSVDDFLRSPKSNPWACWPVRRWDGPRRCDGASAVVICSEDVASSFREKAVHYLGTGNACQTASMSETMYTQPFIVEASRQAYEMAGVSPEDVDVVEMYDYGPAEYLIPLEDMGYLGRGESVSAITEGRTLYSGDKPVNCSGGTSLGVVVGAVGAISIYHLVKQIRAKAGKNQIASVPKVGMAYDCGAARDAVIHIVGR